MLGCRMPTACVLLMYGFVQVLSSATTDEAFCRFPFGPRLDLRTGLSPVASGCLSFRHRQWPGRLGACLAICSASVH